MSGENTFASFAYKPGMDRVLKRSIGCSSSSPTAKVPSQEYKQGDEQQPSKKRHRHAIQNKTSLVTKQPFVAPAPAKYRDRMRSVCLPCFNSSAACDHFEDVRLDLLLVGINPSTTAWESGYFYSNKTNRLWKLLTGKPRKDCSSYFRGILPPSSTFEDQNTLPSTLGVGFVDLGMEEGSDASAFPIKKIRKDWVPDFWERYKGHLSRCLECATPLQDDLNGKHENKNQVVEDNKRSKQEGMIVGKQQTRSNSGEPKKILGQSNSVQRSGSSIRNCTAMNSFQQGHPETSLYQFAPRIVAFAGKTQFMHLLPRKFPASEIPYGLLDDSIRDKCVELKPFGDAKIVVLPSSSGRAVMTTETREKPYRALADLYHEIRKSSNDE